MGSFYPSKTMNSAILNQGRCISTALLKLVWLLPRCYLPRPLFYWLRYWSSKFPNLHPSWEKFSSWETATMWRAILHYSLVPSAWEWGYTRLRSEDTHHSVQAARLWYWKLAVAENWTTNRIVNLIGEWLIIHAMPLPWQRKHILHKYNNLSILVSSSS